MYVPILFTVPLLMDALLASIPGYCKQCCYEHWYACIFLNYGFLWVSVVGLLGYGSSIFNF